MNYVNLHWHSCTRCVSVEEYLYIGLSPFIDFLYMDITMDKFFVFITTNSHVHLYLQSFVCKEIIEILESSASIMHTIYDLTNCLSEEIMFAYFLYHCYCQFLLPSIVIHPSATCDNSFSLNESFFYSCLPQPSTLRLQNFLLNSIILPPAISLLS